MTTRTSIEITEGIRVVCPDDVNLMTPYVLREQQDWFEDEIKFFRRLVTPESVFVDIGANYGLYSLSMARRGARAVWSYEPCAETASCLRESIAANGFAAVTLVQKALSDRPGAGRLLNEENPEMNALLTPGDERGEAVALTSLDEEWERNGWGDVDLVKIDAEGHELKVIAGGERFFTENSPLVMCEVKAGTAIDLGSARRFMELGYACYRLAPGLRALVPHALDEPMDGYLLNVFCCKPDRAARLQARGLLATSLDAPVAADPDAWIEYLRAFPGAAPALASWRRSVREMPLADWNDYRQGLDLYVLAMSEADIALRAAALRRSFLALDVLVRRGANMPRLLSYARVAADYGARVIAVQALQLALKSAEARAAELAGGEPYLPPSAELERREPDSAMSDGKSAQRWALASVLEAFERLRVHSGYFSNPDITIAVVRDFERMGFGMPAMTRRAAVAAERSRASAAAPAPPA